MFVWIGIDVDSQLEKIKKKAQAIEREVGFVNSNFTLPLHVSLKISFPIENTLFDRVKADIISIFDESKPFEIDVRGIEFENNICWIRMERNNSLDGIHDRLNSVMLEKYGIPLHEYDLDYKFHTTLFMDNDFGKVARAYEMLGDVYIPSKLSVDKFVIGTSENGALGTYRVVYEYIKK